MIVDVACVDLSCMLKRVFMLCVSGVVGSQYCVWSMSCVWNVLFEHWILVFSGGCYGFVCIRCTYVIIDVHCTRVCLSLRPYWQVDASDMFCRDCWGQIVCGTTVGTLMCQWQERNQVHPHAMQCMHRACIALHMPMGYVHCSAWPP